MSNPLKAAAPQLPEVENTESNASTTSFPDVDTPDLQTVSSEAQDVADSVKKDAKGLSRDFEAQKAKVSSAAKNAKEKAKKAAGKAQKQASDTAHEAEVQAKRADNWLTKQFSILESDHPAATKVAVAGNLVAVVGLGAFLGFRAWGLHEQGRLDWKSTATGLAVVGAVGIVESTLANYFYKGQSKKQ
ncbi:uncharacterized protein SPSK_07989 [Sporothrix schenckii 1099-18]|uniref:Uncharacterized protein n=2 Tax=Sporothrix schenckii TaxID=29908 RepID=U7Q2E9_SPOS1|nr:uncharacterized protein SPSK_07989 [Sporothrix schenckii 1099-18]ERT01190.1 hypothetical protein HMPREF1624_02432 [Sporothrix schenckii ATCC 58251]KJR88332.1 hypothetical protein SPSK_07989 [Sporothrix schenckii 1099-18]